MKSIKKLMVIEDDEIFVFITKKAIEKTGLVEVIKIFGNGQDALDFLEENIDNPDLLPEIILLDLFMPVMDGWGFLEEYGKLSPKMNKKAIIYICSASVSNEDIKKAGEISSVLDFIIKPVSKERILEIIEKFGTDSE